MMILLLLPATSSADTGNIRHDLIAEYVKNIKHRHGRARAKEIREELSKNEATLQYMRVNDPDAFYLYATRGLNLRLNEMKIRFRVFGDAETVFQERTYPYGRRNRPRNNSERVNDLKYQKINPRANRISNSRRTRTNRDATRFYPNSIRPSNQKRIRRQARNRL